MSGKYIIKGATVVSVDKNIGTVSDCDVLIEDGVIKAVERNVKHGPEHTVIDGTDAIVCPGFIDTHRHTWQTQLHAVGTDYVLSDYFLNLRLIYGASYDVKDAYLGNYVGALESIDSGITYLIDHSHIANSPEHADAALQGLKDAKIRATFCYAMYPNPAWEGSTMDKQREEQTPDWRLEDARRIAQKNFANPKPTDVLRMGFALSEPDMTPVERLVKEIQYAREIGAKVITGHTSFGKWDPGNRRVRALGEAGALGSDMLFSHGNTFTDDEIEAIRVNKCGIGCTPDTEMQMGMSFPVAFKAKDRGVEGVALGVDVCSSAPADMFKQMRLLLQSQRHLEHDQPHLGAPLTIARKCEEVLEMATMGGARAVGLADTIGSVTPGKRADLLLVRCDSPRMVCVHDPVGALVLYADASDIDTVFIDGVVVKEKGKLAGVDWPKVRGEIRASLASIMERAKKCPQKTLDDAKQQMIDIFDAGKHKPKD